MKGALRDAEGAQRDVMSPEETSREPSKQRQVDNCPVLFSAKLSDRKAVCETMYLKDAIFGKKDVCECTGKIWKAIPLKFIVVRLYHIKMFPLCLSLLSDFLFAKTL